MRRGRVRWNEKRVQQKEGGERGRRERERREVRREERREVRREERREIGRAHV